MGDLRWSANEITNKFASITSTFNLYFARIVSTETAVAGLLDAVEMLNDRITELEQAMDAMEAQ